MPEEKTQRLAGKTAFVTAAGQGIGRATAEAFQAAGAHVIATDLNLDLLSDFTGGSVEALNCLDPKAIEAAAAAHKDIDILFNCAGFVHSGTILEATEDEWDFAFDLNVRSMFRTIRAFLPAMIGRGGGSIINMASVASSVKGVPSRAVYATSKAAVIGLTKAVAADFVAKGIRCNAIAPGTVDTPSLRDRINAFDDPVQARKDFIDRQPMRRLATAAEMAPIAVYLAGDESRFATGQVWHVDGGMTI